MIKTSPWILNQCSSNINTLHTTQSDMFHTTENTVGGLDIPQKIITRILKYSNSFT